ncbi:hypothetical protein [Xenophilus sp. Marseille-Q4582]|uniref:hypothetical protein n=1 Tax=Xenophilus sp. Marseille-Q4582 TaxID=2866600 RepID=UPI001CE43662|nr:hypothetical protein [Xenophilus sp. Marseille-Q4582]
MKDPAPASPPSSPAPPQPGAPAQALLTRLKPLATQHLAAAAPAASPGVPPCVLFLALGHEAARAQVLCVTGADFEAAWAAAAAAVEHAARRLPAAPAWLRIDRVAQVQALPWAQLQALLGQVKRNYLRSGIAFDAGFTHALLEQELGANAILYDGDHEACTPNAANLRA